MELRQYLFLLRKWAWLLIIGLVIGAAGAYLFSLNQPVVYQTTSKVMVIRAPDESISGYSAMNDAQLASTYSQLIVTEPVLQAVSEELGFIVKGGQISARQVPDSLLLELTVRDSNAARAALIANSIIDVFIEYNDSLQLKRFASSEQSLSAQIDQVKTQIDNLQAEMSQASQQNLQTQQQQVEEQIIELEREISQLRDEIEALTPTATPTAAPHQVPALPEGVGSAGNQTPEPTVTLTAAQLDYIESQNDLREDKQNQLDEASSMLDLYKQIYLNLLVFGETTPSGGQSNQQGLLQANLALYQQIYSNLLNSYETIRLARLRSTPNVVKIEQAAVPVKPIQPQPLRNAGLGGATGLIIMGAIAFLIEYLDDTLKTPEEINRLLDLAVIGLIGEMTQKDGKDVGAYVSNNPRSPIAESFRTLRTNLDFASVDRPIRTLLVTSAGPGEGKTTTAINLAAVIAQGEKKVALVDSDLRRPTIHKFLQLPNQTGLTDLFRDRDGNCHTVNSWGEGQLSVYTSGEIPPNPTELLGSEKMGQILARLSEENDIVILDSAPFIFAYPIVMAAKVDGVLLVVEPGNTKIDSAQAMLEQLQRAGARVVGVVLNPITRKQAHYYYGRYRYYSYY